jgi:peptidoglycan hydrolase CwlO-like protein
MANLQRLTERVKKMEEWVKENENTGGPQGTLETFNFLVNETRMSAQMRTQMEQQINNLRGLTFEFIQQHELTEEWNEFLKEKEDAVQEQSAEEVPLQEEAESGEEAVKAPKESKKESKEAKK